MNKIQYKKDIHASANKVYKIMLGLEDIKTYQQWTAIFNPTSTYQGSWEKGSKIYFIGVDENGKKGGMVSKIIENIPSEFVSIQHLGILDGDKEITEGKDVEQWAGGLENYSLHENNGITTVIVETDVPDDYLDYFKESWEKALNKLKEISEL